MNLELSVDSISASNGNRKLTLAIEGANMNEILEHLTIKDIVAYFDEGDLLDAIGSDEAKKHFDLIDNKEEE